MTVAALEEVRLLQDKTLSGCNLPFEVIREQVACNIRRGLPQLKPHQTNGDLVALVCGGPSLAQTEDELLEVAWSGAKIVAVNGAYQWCIDHRIKPSAMVMLDGREFNARFLETPVPNCRYLLASQCHPRAFDMCRDRDTYIWHVVGTGQEELDLLKDYYFGNIFPVTIGTTISIRAISVLRMLGFMSFDCFGMDSCWLDGDHHAYSQRENDADGCHLIWVAPRDRPELAER